MGQLYDKDKLFQQAKDAIAEYELFFIEDIIAYLPCSKSTFYNYFPDESDELDALKEQLEEIKVQKKVEIRKKLMASEKAAELLALYRLLATPDEHRKLNQSYVDHTTKGETVNIPISTWVDE